MSDLSTKPSALDCLQSCTFFNALGRSELTNLAAASRVALARRGETIWTADSPIDFFGVVGTGFVKMIRTCPNGADITIELMGPGQVFGILAAVAGVEPPLTAAPVTDLWYLRIPRTSFLTFYRENDELKDRVVRQSTNTVRRAIDNIARLSAGKVEERIAAVLITLGESYGDRNEDGIRLRVPLTRQEIGEMAGTTVESTIRVISQWQKDAVVETEKGVLTIRNENALLRYVA